MSTLIPLQFSIEYLHSRNVDHEFSLGRLFLKFWCLHAVAKAIPNPIMYIFQSLPLSNIVELGAWLVVTRELVGRFVEMEYGNKPAAGADMGKNSTQRGGWISYFQSVTSQAPSEKYLFGQLTVATFRLFEKWPLSVSVLDSSFQTVVEWLGRLNQRPQSKPEAQSWGWRYQWFAGQTKRNSVADEEYDFLEDVMQDIKKA